MRRPLTRAEFERGWPLLTAAELEAEWWAYLHRCAAADLAHAHSRGARARVVRVRRVLVRVTSSRRVGRAA